MIAEIRGYRGKPEYVALRWDGARWIPVRGDRGRHGEGSREDAIALCVRHLRTRCTSPVFRVAGADGRMSM